MITKVRSKTITYFDLFPLLRGLESERPGIKDRIWEWVCDEWDAAFKPYNGRILNINLFYYGVGEEYPLKNKFYKQNVLHSKNIHPEAFIAGKIRNIRLDLNLIWSTYEDEIVDSELFPVITNF